MLKLADKKALFPPVTENRELNLYLSELHKTVFGLGSSGGEIDQSNSPGYHDGRTGSHSELTKAAAFTEADLSTVSITASSAGATYTSAEQTLINEMKADINVLVANLNALIANFNDRKDKMVAANLVEG